MTIPKYFELEGGDKMPRIGFGTWQASNEVVGKAVDLALEAGYRHIDTARAYENEEAIGRSIARWIGNDPDKRKELFVVTKLPPAGTRPEHVQQFFDWSLKDLGLEYIDCYLLHVPFALKYVPGDLHPKNPDGSMMVDHSTDLVAVWKELQKLKASGRARHVGVSNLSIEQLRRLNAVAKPACLQVEVHALFQNRELIAVAKELNIPVVAYSPLGSKGLQEILTAVTGREFPSLLQLPEVVRIAQAHSRTPAQILLRHILQMGLATIPKSTDPTRIKQNLSVWDFELSPAEMAELNALDRGEEGRINNFAFFGGIDKHPEFPFKKL